MHVSNSRVQSQWRTKSLPEFDIFPYLKGKKDTVMLRYQVFSDTEQGNLPFVPQEKKKKTSKSLSWFIFFSYLMTGSKLASLISLMDTFWSRWLQWLCLSTGWHEQGWYKNTLQRNAVLSPHHFPTYETHEANTAIVQQAAVCFASSIINKTVSSAPTAKSLLLVMMQKAETTRSDFPRSEAEFAVAVVGGEIILTFHGANLIWKLLRANKYGIPLWHFCNHSDYNHFFFLWTSVISIWYM